MNHNLIAERAVSALPLSIGTSLALESLLKPRQAPYDSSRVVPKPVDPTQYNSLWVNVMTLIRNFIGSLPKTYQESVIPDEIIPALLFEIETIEQIVKEDLGSQFKPVFYFNDYKRLVQSMLLHKTVRFRLPNTPKQQHYHDILVKVVQAISKQWNVYTTSDHLKPDNTSNKGLLISHMPYDLVSYDRFNTLHLLESHTGKLKTRKDWSSKYYPVGELDISMIPFTRKLLMIFGDHVLIQPMDIKFRKLIQEIAVKRNFHPLMTEENLRMQLDLGIKERYLFELYNKL